MKSEQVIAGILILFSLLSGCAISPACGQDETPQTLTVTLNTPVSGATITTFDCDFTYTPIIQGTDSFVGAKLIINGTETAAVNQTGIVNMSLNRISYTFTSNGTYLWNVRVQNNTNNIEAAANFTLIVTVLPEQSPSPKPTPTSSPAPTPEPTSTPTTTSTSNPTPTPTPTTEPLVIDGWTILMIGLVVLAIILAVVIVFLRNASRSKT